MERKGPNRSPARRLQFSTPGGDHVARAGQETVRMNQCTNCGAGLRRDAVRCGKCGSAAAVVAAPAGEAASAPELIYVGPRAEPRKPGIAMLLSLIVPGLGQLYNGQLTKAIVFFIAGVAAWCVVLGFIVHVVAAIEAYQAADKMNRGGN
jgi:TM2 domain-containing membrane protein YozV